MATTTSNSSNYICRQFSIVDQKSPQVQASGDFFIKRRCRVVAIGDFYRGGLWEKCSAVSSHIRHTINDIGLFGEKGCWDEFWASLV